MKSSEIISSALKECDIQIKKANHFLGLEEDQLQKKPSAKSWSINECFEHINLTLDIYILRMKSGIEDSNSIWNEEFNPGFIGKKMWNSMLPNEKGELSSSMKTFKFMEPANLKERENQPIQNFISKIGLLKDIIESSKNVDLNKVKVTSAVGIILRFKLGDVIPFMINHNARHIWQAEKLLK